MGKGIVAILGKGALAVAHTVGFDVGLGHHIETVTVTELIPVVVIRIVAGPHGIDIELFHYHYVLEHPLL